MIYIDVTAFHVYLKCCIFAADFSSLSNFRKMTALLRSYWNLLVNICSYLQPILILNICPRLMCLHLLVCLACLMNFWWYILWDLDIRGGFVIIQGKLRLWVKPVLRDNLISFSYLKVENGYTESSVLFNTSCIVLQGVLQQMLTVWIWQNFSIFVVTNLF